MLETLERYVPTAEAGASLLQLAFENLLHGYATKEDTKEALETAFLNVSHYGLSQGKVGGVFGRGSAIIEEDIVDGDLVGHHPVVLLENAETGPHEVRLRLGFALQPLFDVYPLYVPNAELANELVA